MDDIKTIGDVVVSKVIAKTIRESAAHVLQCAVTNNGLALTEAQIESLAREIGNNSANLIGIMEIA